MNLLSNDSILGRMFDFLGQLILLNLLWILCCIPVITIGPATCALYFCVLRMRKGGDTSVYKDFFQSFRSNFSQACPAGILLTGAGLLLYLEYRFLAATESRMASLLSFGILALSVLWFVLVLYLFPVISAFSNSLKTLVGHAFYFAFRHLGFLILIGAISFFPMYMTLADALLFPVYVFLWLSLGFSLTAYINSWFFYRMFKPHLDPNS